MGEEVIMSDLDEKLANIVETHGLQSYDTDATVEQIKQVFADAGYAQASHIVMDDKQLERLTGKMTGQEWYDRFIAELENLVEVNRRTQDFTDAVIAARRAAGLDTEGAGK